MARCTTQDFATEQDPALVPIAAATTGPVQRRRTRLLSMPGVVEVHDLHVWEMSSGFPALSAHVLVGRNDDCHDIRRQLKHELHERFAIDHTTLQVDHDGGDLLTIQTPRTDAATHFH